MKKVDVTVLCYHGGFSHDLKTGELIEPDTGENQGYQMCRELDFDILITGHQHREISTKAFGKSIVQPGSKASGVAAIALDIEIENGKVLSVHHEPSLHYVNEDTPVHPELSRGLRISCPNRKMVRPTDGENEGSLLFHDAFAVRVQKHPYIEFIQNVQMDTTNAPISCTSLFLDGAGGFPNEVTMRHIVTNYIYPNTLKVLSVSGRHILEALEQNATYFSIKDGTLTVSDAFKYPKAQPYNYDMWEGIQYVIDVRKPIGSRITS